MAVSHRSICPTLDRSLLPPSSPQSHIKLHQVPPSLKEPKHGAQLSNTAPRQFTSWVSRPLDPRDVTHLPGLSWIDGTMKTAPCGPGGTAVEPLSPTRNPHSHKLGATYTSSLRCPQVSHCYPEENGVQKGKLKLVDCSDPRESSRSPWFLHLTHASAFEGEGKGDKPCGAP